MPDYNNDYHKLVDEVKTKTKFHITIGHQTVVGLVHLFSFSDTEDQQVE